jgi:hypothetical protein
LETQQGRCDEVGCRLFVRSTPDKRAPGLVALAAFQMQPEAARGNIPKRSLQPSPWLAHGARRPLSTNNELTTALTASERQYETFAAGAVNFQLSTPTTTHQPNIQHPTSPPHLLAAQLSLLTKPATMLDHRCQVASMASWRPGLPLALPRSPQ